MHHIGTDIEKMENSSQPCQEQEVIIELIPISPLGQLTVASFKTQTPPKTKGVLCLHTEYTHNYIHQSHGGDLKLL